MWISGEESTYQCRKHGFDPWVGKIPWRRKWQSTPVFLPGKSHGQRSLVVCSPWGCKRIQHDLVTKEQPPFSAPFTEETVLYHYIFLTCHKLTDSICLAFFWALFSVPLTNVSVFMTISYWFWLYFDSVCDRVWNQIVWFIELYSS